MNNINFVQKINMSDEELTKMYMKLSKTELVKMLIACNKALEIDENRPYTKNIDWNEYYDCSDWAHCSNPFHDCINCPLMFANKKTITTSTGTNMIK